MGNFGEKTYRIMHEVGVEGFSSGSNTSIDNVQNALDAKDYGNPTLNHLKQRAATLDRKKDTSDGISTTQQIELDKLHRYLQRAAKSSEKARKGTTNATNSAIETRAVLKLETEIQEKLQAKSQMLTIAELQSTEMVDISAFIALAPDAEKLLKENMPSCTVGELLAYQKLHNISEKTLGAETYWEMKAGIAVERIKGSNDNMEEIAEILKGTINNLSGRTLNANLLLIQIVELKKTEDFQKCLKTDPDLTKAIADFEKRQNAYVVSGGYEQITVRNKKSVDSIYRLIKDPNLSATEKAEAIFKDPVLLMTAGVLFLFGVINPFGKNTDSFLKRLGWVLGGALLGPAVLKKIGVGEMIDDATQSPVSGGSGEAGEAFARGFEKGREGMKKLFETTFPESYSSISVALGSSFNNLTSKARSHNNELKDAAGVEAQYYIEDGKISVLLGDLLGEKKFLNLSKEDLGNISTLNGVNQYISTDTQKKIADAGIEDTDVNAFIQHHLLEKRFENGDEMLRDIFITTEMQDQIDSFALKNLGVLIKGNSELNREVVSNLNNFASMPDPSLRYAGLQLGLAIQEGKIDNFSLDDFPSVSSQDKTEMETFIQKVKDILAGEKHIKDKIYEIGRLNIHADASTGNGDNPVTLQAKLDTLNTLELDSSKVANYNFSVSEFENAKASKQQEIFKAASDLSITSLTIAGTATDVSTEVGRLDRESGKKEELEAIEKLSSEISTVPTQDESVGKFVTFLDKYSDNFAEAQRIIATNPTPQTDSHEEKLVIVAKKIVKKLSEFEVNFKANIGTYIAKIKDESDKVSAINRNNSALKKAQFLQAITEIEKIEASAIVLMNEKDKNVLIVALTNTDYKNKYTEVVNKLSLLRITITTANDSNTKSIALAQQLRDKKVAVINAYDMEIPSITTSFDITNQGLVSNLSQKIQEAFLGLQVIDGDHTVKALFELKEKEIGKAVGDIQNKFKLAFAQINDLVDLENLKQSYETNFKTIILAGSLGALIPSFFQTDEVLEAYEVERERIKIDAFGKKLISDTLHEKGEIHDVYMRYLDLYKDIPEIKKQARGFINGNSHTVAIFLTVLENNTKLQKSGLTLTTVTEHLWDRGINPVRESFTKNAEDLYNDIKSAINKEIN